MDVKQMALEVLIIISAFLGVLGAENILFSAGCFLACGALAAYYIHRERKAGRWEDGEE